MRAYARARSGLASRLFAVGIAAAALSAGQTESGRIGFMAAEAAAQLNLVAGASGQFQLQIKGQSNCVYEIQASTNMVDWTGVAQLAVTGSDGTVVFTDTQAGRYPRRFYRAVQVNAPTASGQPGFSPDRILVKPKPGVDLAGLNLSLGVQVLQVFPGIGNLHVIKVPPSTPVSAVLDTYRQSGLVEYAEPDYYVHALATPISGTCTIPASTAARPTPTFTRQPPGTSSTTLLT